MLPDTLLIYLLTTFPMGIDVYARWRNQTKEQKEAQFTGFSAVAGDVGYLREAYHGGPYVTKFLLEEAFDPEHFGLVNLYRNNRTGEVMSWEDLPQDVKDAPYNEDAYDSLGVQIPAAKMRERLPLAVLLAIYRDVKIYGDGKFPDGFAVNIEDPKQAESFVDALTRVFTMEMWDNSHRYIANQFTDEQVKLVEKMIEEDKLGDLNEIAAAFVDFVKLAEHQEKETGEPIFVYASY